MEDRYRIGPGEAALAAEIARAELICFSDPWSARGIAELFENDSLLSLVARTGPAEGRLAGYIFARRVAGEAEILSMAVLPDHRRSGIGAALLSAAIEALQGFGVGSIFLEVRESNLAAQELYRTHGFRVVGVRPAYYRNPSEDAFLLRLDLEPALN